MIRSWRRPKDLPEKAIPLSSFLKDVRSSDDIDVPICSLLRSGRPSGVDSAPWRSARPQAWIEFVFKELYIIEGFAIRWWALSHASKIKAESSESEQDRFSSVHFVNVQHYGNHGRITAINTVTSSDESGAQKQPTKVFRLKLLQGNLDNIWHRYYFGIHEIEIYGTQMPKETIHPQISTPMNIRRSTSSAASVRPAPQSRPKDLIGWSEILDMPPREKITKHCRGIQAMSDCNYIRASVRMGSTAVPLLYALTPRRRRKQVMGARKAQAAKLQQYSCFRWGSSPKKDKIAPKPAFSSVGISDDVLCMNARTPVRSSSAASRPISAKRPDTRGTVSTRASTPLNFGTKTRPPDFDASHAPSVMGSELPYGWLEYTDDDGKVYYHNSLSKETTWTKPNREPPVPAGWVAHDNDDGERYYHKIGTNETTWTRPAPPVQDTIDGSQLDWQKRQTNDGKTFYANPSLGVAQWGAPTMFSEIEEDAILPPNWSKEADEKGATYYFNYETSEATWSHPVQVD